jgi:hypothetical protein
MLINHPCAGDDWFYFEDDSSSNGLMQSKSEDFDVLFETRSAGVTSTITFLFEEGLQHTKLHDGAYKFAGVKTSTGTDANDVDDSAKGFLTKQGL